MPFAKRKILLLGCKNLPKKKLVQGDLKMFCSHMISENKNDCLFD